MYTLNLRHIETIERLCAALGAQYFVGEYFRYATDHHVDWDEKTTVVQLPNKRKRYLPCQVPVLVGNQKRSPLTLTAIQALRAAIPTISNHGSQFHFIRLTAAYNKDKNLKFHLRICLVPAHLAVQVVEAYQTRGYTT